MSLAFISRHARHASQLLANRLLAFRRLLGKPVDRLADCILPLGWKLVQPVVQTLERPLLFGRELVESIQPLLKPLPLRHWQTVKRFLPLLGRHRFELFDGRPGAAIHFIGEAALLWRTHRA